MRQGIPKLSGMAYGADYNPEQWPQEIWVEDIRLMQQARVNLVSLGVFAWSRLEPRPGHYEFAWLDKLMDLLHQGGIYVNLATATAAPPMWIAHQHPESLPIKADGTKLWPGSRQGYCPSSSAYRQAAARLVRQLAQCYKDHPALAMWHIGNEYGCHVWECYCDRCASAFQTWLLSRYANLEALNTAWYSDFWSQRYEAWEEIVPPRQTPYMPNPSQLLDWRRFCSDNLLECYQLEAEILRTVTPEIPVATNFMGFHKPLDYWCWAQQQDLIANDIYPDPSQEFSRITGAMEADLMRSLGQGKPWLVMEQVTGQVQWRERNALKRPGQMRLWSYQAVARGAKGIMFFQWRASRGGAERFHGAMLPHSGTESRIWQEAVKLGRELEALELGDSQPRAEVAMLLDWGSWWALESDGHPARMQLLPLLKAWYQPLFKRNLAVDFVHPEFDLSRYKAVLAPNLHLVSDASMVNLSNYVANGGTLLVGYYSGIVDSNNQVRLPAYPGAFRKLLGLWVEEFEVLAKDQALELRCIDDRRFTAKDWADVVHLEGASPLALFVDGFAANRPAFTKNQFGRGLAFYLGTQLEEAGLDWAIGQVLAQAEIMTATTPAGVEQINRQTNERTIGFHLNHNPHPVELWAEGFNLLTGQQVQGLVQLEAYGVLVLERKNSSRKIIHEHSSAHLDSETAEVKL